MAATVALTDYLPTSSSNDTNYTIPLADIGIGSDVDEDIREFLYFLLQTCYDAYAADVAGGTDPTYMAISKSGSINTSGNLVTTFKVRLTRTVDDSSAPAES